MATSFDLVSIREALADALRSGVARDLQVYAFYPETSLNFPCLLIEPDPNPINYLEAMGRGLGRIKLTVRAYTSRTRSGEMFLSQLMSAGIENQNSVFDVIERERPKNNGSGLGGLVDELAIRDDVRHIGPVRIDDESQTGAFSAEWSVDLYLSTGSLA